MTALVWRRRPWKDATLAVAHCYRGLADFADALAGMYSGLRPRLARRHGAPCPGRSGPPCGPRWRRPAAASAKCKARVPRAAPARSSCITCSTGPRTVSSPWSPPPTCSNRTRRAGWDAMPAPTCATPCTATPAYAMPSLAPPMPPTRARRIACANGWNATAPICANFAAPRSRTRPSWPASFRCWTGCNSPPSPSGRPCSTPPSCRPARHPARPPRRASLEHAAPEPATGV